MTQFEYDLDQLTARLQPFVAGALTEASEFAGEVISDLTKKASSGAANMALSGLRSLGVAAWDRIRSSKANAVFEQQWAAAASVKAREAAIRLLLRSDPKLAKSLYTLLQKRDFVRAIAEHCEHLPNIGIIDTSMRLSDVFVPLTLEATEEPSSDDTVKRHSTVTIDGSVAEDALQQLRAGNHLIEGSPGSGKSTLARLLVISEAHRLLEDRDSPAFDHVRIPIFVTAKSLTKEHSDLATSLLRAINADVSFAGLGPLPDNFFVPYSDSGHSYWLLVIDGLDEIEDRRERQRLWDAITEVHSQTGDAFRFIVTARPDSIRIRLPMSFARWRVRPFTEASRILLAHKYISVAKDADAFVARTTKSDLNDLMSTPLFGSIAASLYANNKRLPDTKLELLNEFAFTLAEKVTSGLPEKYDVLVTLLSEIAADPKTDLSRLIDTHTTEFECLLPARLPRSRVQSHLSEFVNQSGLVRTSAGTYDFVHDVFRSYFFALRIARKHEPGLAIWKTIDPFVVGWTTVEYLCEAWAEAGKDVSSAVEGLSDFGEGGTLCATEVAIACSAIDGAIIKTIVERNVREMFSTGPTIDSARVLTRLAQTHPLVKKRLVDLARGDRDTLGARLLCAECLVDAGHINEGVGALNQIATDQNMYEPDRVRAAELLIRHGHYKTALSVLNHLAENGEALRIRADAVYAIFEHTRTDSARKALIDCLATRPLDDIDAVDETTLERLLAIGEKDLALPLLRQRATPPITAGFLTGVPRDRIFASKAIATHYDKTEGIEALNRLLESPLTSPRGKAEVIEALAAIGAEREAEARLKELSRDTSKYNEFDWFLLELLVRFRLDNEARNIGTHLIRVRLEHGQSPYDLPDLVARLLPIADRDQLADLIRPKTAIAKQPQLATCLAILGFRKEGVGLLLSWLKSLDHKLKIDSATALSALGERNAGVKALSTITKDRSTDPDTRLVAADALARIGAFKAADRAYTLLLQDETLDIKARSRAAYHFDDEDRVKRTKIVWDTFIPFIEDPRHSICDRVVAAERLLRTSENPSSDFDHFDVIDDLLSILEQHPSPSEQIALAGALAKGGVSLDDTPDIESLLEDDRIPARDRIELLSHFSSSRQGDDADALTLAIATRPDVSYAVAIDALAALPLDTSSGPLKEIVATKGAPPHWRLRAAKPAQGRYRHHDRTGDLLTLINDETISIRIRLDAINGLPDSFLQRERIALLNSLASTHDLSNWERLAIAELAIEWRASELGVQLLTDALGDRPLSIAEMAEISRLLNSVGHKDRAHTLLLELLSLPDSVLAETEDHSSTVEAAILLAELDDRLNAVSFLRRVLELADWLDVVHILEGITQIAGPEIAESSAAQLLPTLISAPNTYTQMYMISWRQAYEHFLKKGWTSDLAPLLVAAKDERRFAYDRVRAAELIFRNSAKDTSKNWSEIAKAALIALSVEKSLRASDLIDLIPILNSCDLHERARSLLVTLKESDLKADERRSLARVLHGYGAYNDAKALIAQTNHTDPQHVRHFDPDDEWLLSTHQSEQQAEDALTRRAFDTNRPLIDRLFDARDAVSKFGNRQALRLILDTAFNVHADSNDRLDAVDILDELDYRDLSRQLLLDLIDDPELDDWWVGDKLLRFGKKAAALKRFEKSIETCPPSYRDQIACRLSDLGAVDLLDVLDARHAPNNTHPKVS